VVGLLGFLAAEGAEGAEHAAGTFNWFAHNAWLIPLLPFASAAVILAFGKRMPGKGSAVGIAAVFVAFLCSVGVLWNFVSGTTGEFESNRVWFEIGPLELQLGILIDGLPPVTRQGHRRRVRGPGGPVRDEPVRGPAAVPAVLPAAGPAVRALHRAVDPHAQARVLIR
jgi:hypothetical protein